MPIGNAIQKGQWVYVYDEKGHKTATISTGTHPGDGLMGYTSSSVNVRAGDFIYSYDERGHKTGTKSAK